MRPAQPIRLSPLLATARTACAALTATATNPSLSSPRRPMVLLPPAPSQLFTTLTPTPTVTAPTRTTTSTAVPPPPPALSPVMAQPPPLPLSSSPAFTIREATPADADALCDAFFDAFAEDEIARRVFPAGSRRARAEMRSSFAEDLANPECHKFVAVDSAASSSSGTEHVVAVATWTQPGASWERPAPAAAATAGPAGGDGGEAAAADPEGDGELGAEFFAMMDRKHAEHMGRRPHWTLGFLAVRRAWQGRGVTRPLVAWGLACADRDGVETYVQASPHAAPIYRRYGFEQIDTYSFRQIDYTEVFMLRKPRPPPGDDAAAAHDEAGAAPP